MQMMLVKMIQMIMVKMMQMMMVKMMALIMMQMMLVKMTTLTTKVTFLMIKGMWMTQTNRSEMQQMRIFSMIILQKHL